MFGLVQIFDEIINNAKEHTFRDPSCNKIKININKNTGEISCWNNGNKSIPIEMHKKENKYIPELIFYSSKLLDKKFYEKIKIDELSGYGAKLTNRFSKRFYIEVNDSNKKLKYRQHFYDNMFNHDSPIITHSHNEDSYVNVIFTPDYLEWGFIGLSEPVIKEFSQKVYDIVNSVSDHVKIYLNDELIINI